MRRNPSDIVDFLHTTQRKAVCQSRGFGPARTGHAKASDGARFIFLWIAGHVDACDVQSIPHGDRATLPDFCGRMATEDIERRNLRGHMTTFRQRGLAHGPEAGCGCALPNAGARCSGTLRAAGNAGNAPCHVWWRLPLVR